MRKTLRFFGVLSFAFFTCKSQAAVDFSGFASAGYITGDTKQPFLTGADVITQSAAFGADNVIGVQFKADINDSVDVTGQFLAKGVLDSYNLEARWAYITYTLSPELSLRAGKMNFPGTLYNEVQEVGFSYPWIRNPMEVYTIIPITSYSGVDVLYRFDAFNVDWVFQPAIGSFPLVKAMGTTIDIDLTYGFSLVGTTDYGKFNFSLINTENTDIPIPNTPLDLSINVDFTFAILGYDLEFDDVVLISELIKRDTRVNRNSDVPSTSDIFAYYLTLGYRLGNFLPHLTYAASESDNKVHYLPAGSAMPGPPPQGVPAQYWVAPQAMVYPTNLELPLQHSYTAGLRYDLNSQTALKMEMQRITPEAGSWGVFYSDPGKHADLYSVAVDVVF